MGFPVVKKLDLAYLGEGWNTGAYINFNGLTFGETRGFADAKLNTENPEDKENLDFVINLLESHFLDGKAWNGQELVDLTAKDISDLPVDVITKAVELLGGTPDPKSLAS